MGLNGGELGIGTGWKFGLETVLDHGGVSGGYKIEVYGLGGMHEGSAPCN
jgi:hypothetical protein